MRDLQFKLQALDIAFHPTANIIASTLIDGSLHCHSFNIESPRKLFSLSKIHKDSCRAVQFNHDGSLIFTASVDKSLACTSVATGKHLHSLRKAHSTSINCLKTIKQHLIVSGDDSGCIKLWDIRQQKSTLEWRDNVDFISDFDFYDGKHALVATSGDGTLSVYDVRKARKPIGLSENQDDELLSVRICKGGNKLVVGSQSGILSIFTWGQFLDSTDRMPGHPHSVDSLCKIDEETLLTASSDGIIRKISILPNKFIGVVGAHEEGLPAEKIALDSTNTFVASCGHETVVKIWNINDESTASQKEDLDEEEEADALSKQSGFVESSDEDQEPRKKKKRRKLKIKSVETDKVFKTKFFADLD